MLKRYIIIVVVACLLYTVLDAFNVPSKLGLLFELNIPILSIVINNGVLVSMAIVTYYLVEKRSIDKQYNQEKVLLQLLRSIYNECLSYISMLEYISDRIKHKLDFEKERTSDDPISKIQNAPFENEKIVFRMFEEGVLNSDWLEEYLCIQNLFREYVNAKIILDDYLSQELTKRKSSLVDKIKQEIKKIEKH